MIRKANKEDAEMVARLYTTSFPEHIMVQRGILNDPEYLSRKFIDAEESWVVEDKDGIILGVAALAICRPVGLGEIERVCVSEEYRGNGVALKLCEKLVEDAKEQGLGFVEAFARGDQPSMQRTFEKLGFRVYGIAPRFEVVHDGAVVREQFVHMGLVLKPETVDECSMQLISCARKIYDCLAIA